MYKLIAYLIFKFPTIKSRLIADAHLNPYWHLDGYMLRYWVTPRLLLTRDENGNLVPYSWLPKLLKVRLHIILRSDNGRHMHNHPCDNTSILLEGKYLEEVCQRGKKPYAHIVRAGSVAHRKAETYHRLTILEGECVTSLWFMGKKSNDWGFLVDDAFVSKDKYFTEHCDEIHSA